MDERKFWEWCGVKGECQIWDCFNKSEENCSVCPYWKYPPIDLNNLFKYAVPKVLTNGRWLGMVTVQYSEGVRYLWQVYPEKQEGGENKDPAIALYQAICKVMEAA